jgi:zinc/manganese transport system substrate-binding protein
MAPYKGTAILTYHESWDYFAEYFGLPIPVPPKTIEEKPGFVPSPRRVEEVIRLSKDKNVKLIVTEPYYDVSIAQTIADRLGVPWLSIALYGIGLKPKQTDYISMVDDVVDQFVKTLGAHAR